ncbi:MAG: site-2 protease family protein [Planctomycetota bacterium]
MFLALLLIFGLKSLITGGIEAMGLTLALLGLVFVSVFLHEVGHTITGIRTGARAQQILLWPLGGLAELHGVPPFPNPQIKVSISGPLVNLLLAFIFFPLLLLLEIPLNPFGGGPSLSFGESLLRFGFLANIVLFALNMLPGFPLDGGNILRWFLAGRRPDRGFSWATEVTVKVGKVVAVLVGVAGIALHLTNDPMTRDALLLLFLGIAIYLFSERERRLLEYGAMQARAAEFLGQPYLEKPPEPPAPGFFGRWKKRRQMRKREREVQREVEVRKRVDFLLDKIAREGLNALTEKEKAFLKQASKRYQKNSTP